MPKRRGRPLPTRRRLWEPLTQEQLGSISDTINGSAIHDLTVARCNVTQIECIALNTITGGQCMWAQNQCICNDPPGCGAASPPPLLTIEVRNYSAGTGNYIKVYKNGSFYNDSRYLSYFDFKAGDTAKFEAVTISGWTFQRFCDKNYPIHINCVVTNPFTTKIVENGVMNAFFKESVDTSGYICTDDCQNLVKSGGQYKTQSECKTACAPPPTPPPPISTVPCDYICVGKDLYSQKRDTVGNCVKDKINTANYPGCISPSDGGIPSDGVVTPCDTTEFDMNWLGLKCQKKSNVILVAAAGIGLLMLAR